MIFKNSRDGTLLEPNLPPTQAMINHVIKRREKGERDDPLQIDMSKILGLGGQGRVFNLKNKKAANWPSCRAAPRPLLISVKPRSGLSIGPLRGPRKTT